MERVGRFGASACFEREAAVSTVLLLFFVFPDGIADGQNGRHLSVPTPAFRVAH
jgi:hypothetical protein